MRDAKQKLKNEKDQQRNLLQEIKLKHNEIISLEEKYKQIQAKVKAQQDKGFTPQASKQAITQQKKQD